MTAPAAHLREGHTRVPLSGRRQAGLLLALATACGSAAAPATFAADGAGASHHAARLPTAAALAGLATGAARPSSALPTRSPAQLQALFAKGAVTGADVVLELEAIRKLLSGQRNAAAVGAVMGSGKDEPTGRGSIDLQAELLRAAVKAGEEAIKPYVSSIGFGALDGHLKEITADPKLLLEESLKLPSPKDMTSPQMQRVVNMAAIVLATRATGKVLKRALADFAQVEQDYTRLIERREGAAKVLFEVLARSASNDAPELAGTFGSDDMKFLRQNASQMSLAQFSNDLGAQNLALRMLSKSDPAAFGDYKARSDGLLKSTRGYIRSAAGVTAFAALLANFGNETMAAARDKRGAEIFAAFPFAWEFVKEVPPLLKASWAVGAAGIVELPSKASKRFRVIDGEKAATPEDLGRSEELFAAMKKRNVDALFAQSFFRSGFDGLLYKLYRCDPSEVGRMLDTAVPIDAREKFAAGYLAIEGARFSFANALKQPGPSKKEAELGDELLRQEHRERSTVPAMGEVQRLATQGYGRWNNDQMLRLILANREGTAAHATLQLDEVRIRPVPTMQSVFAYESLVDECSKQFGADAASAAAAAASAAPGRKP